MIDVQLIDVHAGLCSVTFRGLEPAEILDLARAAGLTAVEWGGDVHVPPGDETRAAEIGARSRACGVDPASYGSYLGAREPVGDPRPTMETAVALGAPNVRVWCPFGVRPGASEEQRSDVTRGIAVAAAAAEDVGLTLSLEFHPGTLTETADSTVRLVREVDAPNLFSYWQPIPGGEPEAQHAELATVVSDLSHLHVFAWDADGTRRDLSVAHGLWSQPLHAARSNPGRWARPRVAFLEFVAGDRTGQLAKDASTLKSWLTA